MDFLKDVIPWVLLIVSVVTHITNIRHNTNSNKEKVDGFETLLEKKEKRIKELEDENIKIIEALERSYMRYEEAYNIFTQTKDYEKDMQRLEKDMEKGLALTCRLDYMTNLLENKGKQ